MMSPRKAATGATLVALIFTAGCEVEKTRDGELPDVDVSAEAGNLPEYEVIKTEEGKMPSVDVDVESGQMPAYEIEGPEVTVGSKTVEVEVPTVDVDLPDDDDKK